MALYYNVFCFSDFQVSISTGFMLYIDMVNIWEIGDCQNRHNTTQRKPQNFQSACFKGFFGFTYLPDQNPFYQHGLNIVPAWIIYHRPNKMYNEITYPIREYKGCTVTFWEPISYFIPHVIMVEKIYSCWYNGKYILINGAPDSL